MYEKLTKYLAELARDEKGVWIIDNESIARWLERLKALDAEQE